MIKNQWYTVLSSREVKTGRLTAAKRLNLELCFFRNKDGIVSCVEDRCSHRKAQLSKGKCTEDGLVKCPFHGIEFNSSGECEFIPAYGISNQEDLSRFNVQEYIVREKHGIIYFWYGNETPNKNIPFFDDEIDESYACSEFKDPWSTHYSRAIENQLDVVHLPFIHHNTIGKGNKTLVNGPKVIVDAENNLLITSADNEKGHGQTPKDPKNSKLNPPT